VVPGQDLEELGLGFNKRPVAHESFKLFRTWTISTIAIVAIRYGVKYCVFPIQTTIEPCSCNVKNNVNKYRKRVVVILVSE
jgi:hypothetical protein